MTDESLQNYPSTADALLNKALGPEGYYGAFTANMHTDFNANQDGKDSKAGSDLIIASALSRGVPVVSARQMLEWLDGRNGSSFSVNSWDGEVLNFSIATGGAGANGLQAMLPVRVGALKLVGLTRAGGVAVPLAVRTIKGFDYAFFTAQTTSYDADYVTDTTPPQVSNVQAEVTGPDTVVVTWATDEAATSHIELGTSATSLQPGPTDSTLTTSHSITLSGLTTSTTYHFRVTSVDAAVPANVAVSPSPPADPATFRTGAPQFVDTTSADFAAGTPASATYVAETTDGEVILKPTVGTEFSTPAL